MRWPRRVRAMRTAPLSNTVATPYINADVEDLDHHVVMDSFEEVGRVAEDAGRVAEDAGRVADETGRGAPVTGGGGAFGVGSTDGAGYRMG